MAAPNLSPSARVNPAMHDESRHDRGNKRPGALAKLIFALIVLATVAAIAIGVDRFRDEPPTVPGGKIAPGGAIPPPGPS